MIIETYTAIGLLTFLASAIVFGRSDWITTYNGRPERNHIIFAAFVSVFAGALWPLTFIYVAAYGIVRLAMIGRGK